MNDLLILQLPLGSMANYTYIIADKKTGSAAAIDPWDDIPSITSALTKNKLTIGSILLTHGHFDHVDGAEKLSLKFNVPVYLSEHEAAFYTPKCKSLMRTSDQQILKVGELSVKTLHTPGHTPGCQCFLVEDNLFTGDTLFVDAVGRTDLPGGDPSLLFKSLQTIKRLANETVIWPGHDYGATPSAPLSLLKKENPYLLPATENDFLNLAG